MCSNDPDRRKPDIRHLEEAVRKLIDWNKHAGEPVDRPSTAPAHFYLDIVHDSDNLPNFIFNPDGAAERIGLLAQILLHETFIHYRDRRRIGVVGTGEETSTQQMYAQRFKQTGRGIAEIGDAPFAGSDNLDTIVKRSRIGWS